MAGSSNYSHIADVYDFLVNIFSMGQTRASKLSQLKYIKPHHRVLVAGAGAGEEVVATARVGAKVTVVELAAGMVDVVRNRLEKAQLLDNTTLVVGDIMEHRVPDEERYDVVTANFLFAAFHKDRWPVVMEQLMSMVKPGGQLLIADYAPIDGPFFMRMLQAAYYVFGNSIVALTAGNVLHKPYEPPCNWYSERLEKAGFVLDPLEYFRMGPIGPRWVVCWRARKPMTS